MWSGMADAACSPQRDSLVYETTGCVRNAPAGGRLKAAHVGVPFAAAKLALLSEHRSLRIDRKGAISFDDPFRPRGISSSRAFCLMGFYNRKFEWRREAHLLNIRQQ